LNQYTIDFLLEGGTQCSYPGEARFSGVGGARDTASAQLPAWRL
jgi:hypothetical protein